MRTWFTRIASRLLPRATAVLQFRPASTHDIDGIVQSVVAEARAGHFNGDYELPAVAMGLRHQVLSLVNDAPVPMPGPRNGAEGRALVVQVNGNDVGFVLLLSDRPGTWSSKVEIFALVIAPKARGMGIGTQAVRQLVDGVQSDVIYARCYSTSSGMRRIFERCGFTVTGSTAKGTVTLERRAIR